VVNNREKSQRFSQILKLEGRFSTKVFIAGHKGLFFFFKKGWKPLRLGSGIENSDIL
jgi:hypothetical protein